MRRCRCGPPAARRSRISGLEARSSSCSEVPPIAAAACGPHPYRRAVHCGGNRRLDDPPSAQARCPPRPDDRRDPARPGEGALAGPGSFRRASARAWLELPQALAVQGGGAADHRGSGRRVRGPVWCRADQGEQRPLVDHGGIPAVCQAPLGCHAFDVDPGAAARSAETRAHGCRSLRFRLCTVPWEPRGLSAEDCGADAAAPAGSPGVRRKIRS